MATGDKKLASFTQGSEEEYTLICLPCHRVETSRPAQGFCIDCLEHLCQDCINHHKRATLSRYHKYKGRDTMPSTQQLTDTPVHTGATDTLTTPCPHHNTEMIKFYCHSDKMLLCSICVARKHTKSCYVDYIPDISDRMVNSEDYKHTMERMDKLFNKCTTMKTETSTKSNKSNHSLNNALKELQHYRTQVNKRMDQQQKDIEAKIQSIQTQNDEQRTTVTTIIEDTSNTVKETYASIKQLNTSNQPNQLFMEIKQAQTKLQDYEANIQSLSAVNIIDEYTFIPNKAIYDALETEKTFGNISPKHQPRAVTSPMPDLTFPLHASITPETNILTSPLHASITPDPNVLTSSVDVTITPTCLGEICVKSSEDMAGCWISSMTILPPDRLVLADFKNNSIKLVDVNSKSIISRLLLGTFPHDITSTSSTQVAVTVPDSRHIQFLSVSKPFLSFSYKLSKSHTIQTDGKCRGICCHQDKLIVTYQDPIKLEILDMSGRVITKVTTYSTGADIFNEPAYVQANSRSIYVADCRAYKVIILNWNGEITGRITDIGYPRGLALLHDGGLLVCDMSNGRVYQVAGDGTNRRTILQDVRHPSAVCVDDEEQKLYISRLSLEDKLSNNILIYNI